ncbi:MAG: hypothetical protein FD180_2931 [Planctomycetota bacterium]|nr:MAG: hypothetical protein FD180_2931 [Planctomycetota bacterium]
MKRFIPILVVFISSCADRHLLINHHYRKDGYEVRGIHGTWVWNDVRRTATLSTGEGFERRVLVDKDGDFAVDEVTYRRDTYSRGLNGSKNLFEDADGDFDVARKRYDIDALDKEWKEMPPDEKTRLQDYYK